MAGPGPYLGYIPSGRSGISHLFYRRALEEPFCLQTTEDNEAPHEYSPVARG